MMKLPLQALRFCDDNGKFISGLVSTKAHGMDLPVAESVSVQEARAFGEVDYIFFRRFADGRSSQIAAYIVDNQKKRVTEEDISKLHWKLWLHGSIPLLYIAWPTKIDILSCARGADFWASSMDGFQYSPARSIHLADLRTSADIAKALDECSALRLLDGTFWDDPANRSLADYSKSSHVSIIQAITEADVELNGDENSILRHLLLLMILIKYLEDRKVFPERWFETFRQGANNFFDVLKGGEPEELHRLLDALHVRFNGDIFNLPRTGLSSETLKSFAYLVEAKTLNNQRYLWAQYSFEHLPVEVISHLYQRFANTGDGAVYTPPFLVSMLLDATMPYSLLSGEEKILDPACGSGIFLVGAFRRLVNSWRYKNEWQRPTVGKLKEILTTSIFGVEVDPFATKLTAFSLSIAVCDALQPNVIWDELHFDSLSGTNIIQTDFFKHILAKVNAKQSLNVPGFDIIVGNPPFGPKLSEAAIDLDRIARKAEKRPPLPDKQIAYLFLDQALKLLKETGRLCLIQPNGLIYNSKALLFTRHVFKKYKVSHVLDFTSIRGLYDAADPKTISLLITAGKPAVTDSILHITFRRTLAVKERLYFEVDHYDHHVIPCEVVERNPYVWRANLLGGGRLTGLSSRLRRLRTLAQFIAAKNWDYGEGFTIGNRSTPAPYLVDKALLPTSALSDSGLDVTAIVPKNPDLMYEAPRTETRFMPPLVLIKELETLPAGFWNDGNLGYKHRILGIRPSKRPEPCTDEQISELKDFYQKFRRHKEVYRFFLAMHGSEAVVSKSTAVRKQDIDLLPYPEDDSDLNLTFWEEVLCSDTLRYTVDYVRLGQNSDLLNKSATHETLDRYSTLFTRLLGTIYKNLHPHKAIFTDGLICQIFYFGLRPDIDGTDVELGKWLNNLVFNLNSDGSLRTTRVVRYYSQNILILIKPDRLRYWIESVAVRDADDTLKDLRQQGY